MSTAKNDFTPHRHRLTVEQYYRMTQVGLLATDTRTELIEGQIIDMAPLGNSHMGVVERLDRRLQRALDGRAVVRVQGAIRLGDYSMSQPDLAILRWRGEYYYDTNFAEPADVLVVI